MKAKCAYYGKCSGCTLQQFPYVKQLHDKSRRVSSDLHALLPNAARAEDLIQSVVPSPLDQGYRTSGKLCLHEDELGRKSIGLYERGSKKVVSIPGCTVHHPEINKLVQRLFGFGKKLPAPFYHHAKKGFQPGKLKFVVLRYSPETKEFGLVISHTGVSRDDLKIWASGLNLSHVSFYDTELKESDGDLVMARGTTHLAGPKTFRFQIGEESFAIDPIAFFQANHSLAPRFIETIAAWHKGDRLLDLYGGFGTYSLAAKDNFSGIAIVEANPHAMDSAKEWTHRLGTKHITTHALSVEDYFKGALKKDDVRRITDIIINPPRTGISRSVIEGLRSPKLVGLERLTYVSCELGTLKRDLREIIRDGLFVIDEVIPFDMFPQTEHIETVVRLKRRMPIVGTVSEKKPSLSAPRDQLSNSSRERPAPRSGQANHRRRNP